MCLQRSFDLWLIALDFFVWNIFRTNDDATGIIDQGPPSSTRLCHTQVHTIRGVGTGDFTTNLIYIQ